MQQPVEMGTVIQAQLQAVGIKAKIQTMEWGAYLKKYLDGPDMAEMSWNPSIGDPDHVTYMLLSSDRFPPAFNAGFYQNARVDELLRKGRTTVGDGERAAIYKEAQRIISDEAPWMGHVLQGDLGRSIPLGRAVLPEVLLRFKATLVLTAGALLIAILLGLSAGIVSAVKQYTWLDRISMGVAVTGVSLPVFWTG